MAQTYPNEPLTQVAGSTERSNLSNAITALRSSFSGTSAPSSPSPTAGQIWWDSANSILKIYDGTRWRPLGGNLYVDTSQVGNVGTGVDDLITYSVPASTLAVDGDTLTVIAYGTFAANANNKQVRLVYGSTELATTGAIAQNSGSWRIEAQIVRTAAATQDATAFLALSDAGIVTPFANLTTPAETLSGAVTLKCTGEATSDDDIVQEGLIVRLDWVGA